MWTRLSKQKLSCVVKQGSVHASIWTLRWQQTELLPLCFQPTQCGRCGLKRAKGRAEHCTVSLHSCCVTWAPVRLHFWETSAGRFLLCSSAEIPHRRDPAMQSQGAEHALLLRILTSLFYTVFKHRWIFIHVAEAGLPCKCILKVCCLPIPSCTSDKLQCYFCLTEFSSNCSLSFSTCLCFSGWCSAIPVHYRIHYLQTLIFIVKALHFLACLSVWLTFPGDKHPWEMGEP